MNNSQGAAPTRLHPTAERTYRFIVRYKRQNAGDSPTRREICAGVGIPSTSMVNYYLEALEAAGRLRRPKRGKARMIAIPGASWEFDEVGQAAESEQNKCALCGDGEGADLPEEERKVGERLGEMGAVQGI